MDPGSTESILGICSSLYSRGIFSFEKPETQIVENENFILGVGA